MEDCVRVLKKFVNATLKNILYFETSCTKHLLIVHMGSSCVNFDMKYVFQLQVIADCDDCTTSFLEITNKITKFYYFRRPLRELPESYKRPTLETY